MKIGKLSPVSTGLVKYQTWEKIYETELSAQDTSVTISGLSGNTDEMYLLDARIKSDGANVLLRFNSDTGTNYGNQILSAENTSFYIVRGASNSMQLNTAALGANHYIQFCVEIYAKSGYVRTVTNKQTTDVNGTTIDLCAFNGHSWNNTADEITAINLVALGGNFLTGSRYSLYRKVYTT